MDSITVAIPGLIYRGRVSDNPQHSSNSQYGPFDFDLADSSRGELLLLWLLIKIQNKFTQLLINLYGFLKIRDVVAIVDL